MTEVCLKDCCNSLLEEISRSLNISKGEILRKIKMPQCNWVYNRSSKEHKKGERCGGSVVSETHVFCEKHHKQANSNTNGVILGTGELSMSREVYIPELGLARCSKKRNEAIATLVQGDLEKFSKYLENEGVTKLIKSGPKAKNL